MVAVLRVLEGVSESILANEDRNPAGLLVGLRDGSLTLVISALHGGEDDLSAISEMAAALLPPPLTVVGCYGRQGARCLQTHTESGDVAACIADGNSSSAVQYSIKQGGSLTPCQPEALTSGGSGGVGAVLGLLTDRYVPVRCVADLVLTTANGGAGAASSAGAGSSLGQAFDELEEELCGSVSIFVAEVPAAGPTSDSPAAAAAAADRQPAGTVALPGAEPFAALGASWARAAVLRPYMRAAPGGSSGGGRGSGPGAVCAAPRLSWHPQQLGSGGGSGSSTSGSSLRHTALYLDVLCYVPADMPAAEAVARIVRPAVRRQLAAMRADSEDAAAAAAAVGVAANRPPLRALHFLPPGLCHHVSLLYPLPRPSIEADEAALLARRQACHRLLGLPANRPLLRVANAVDWSGSSGGGSGVAALAAALAAGGVGGKQRLRDVHVGLPAQPVGGSVHLVQGSYDYYHYMQDKFDDCGWGCAYRSLQTICSWFARQGYAARPPPTHREIQQALVAIGDKDPSFVGSRQWIGAIELGFVLDTLLGVQHRVLSVSSGDDMPSLARQIAHHFDTQGTPIMIGGGVLAYTLLGIDFDECSGRCAFLILDPHYTGGEDLKKIHSGQWVNWKQPGDKAAAGGDLFVKNSFYNLLCPQRPSTV